VLLAAADLNVFTILKAKPMSAKTVAGKLEADTRAITILLDALAAMALLTKQNKEYSLSSEVAQLLTEDSSRSILPAIRHQANCLRRWVQLPQVIRNGQPAERILNIHNETEDIAAFIGAMDNFSTPVATDVIHKLGTLNFCHLLDVGGASGTWTIEFLRAVPEAKATLFDLPEVIPMAKEHIAKAGLTDQVEFVEGDFYTDDLPAGADFIWLSAIAHQNSRQQNQQLFSKLYTVLENGGKLVLRDVVMDESRTKPEGGALFAINMLVATEGGGTYTFDEFRMDLLNAGFANITLVQQDEFMNSLISALKEEK
jgi:SAM-dependent methyltransferase